jgi:hypothetical protein
MRLKSGLQAVLLDNSLMWPFEDITSTHLKHCMNIFEDFVQGCRSDTLAPSENKYNCTVHICEPNRRNAEVARPIAYKAPMHVE